MKPLTTVPNGNAFDRIRLIWTMPVSFGFAIVIFMIASMTWSPGSAQAQSMPAVSATWTSSGAKQQPEFSAAVAKKNVRRGHGLAWGHSTTPIHKPATGSAFTNIRTVSAVEPLPTRSAAASDEPNLFLAGAKEETYPVDPQLLQESQDNARRVALMRATGGLSCSSQNTANGIQHVNATADPKATPFVAGRIPLSSDPFGDSVAPFANRQSNPHVDPHEDPFGDRPASAPVAPTVTLSPAPMAAPVLRPAVILATQPMYEPQPAAKQEIQQPRPKLQRALERSRERSRRVKAQSPPPQRISQAGPDLFSPVSPAQRAPATAPLQGNPFLNDDPSGVPEFPEYKKRREQPPTPDDMRGSRSLPNVEEPPRPGSDGETARDLGEDESELLDFPGEKEDLQGGPMDGGQKNDGETHGDDLDTKPKDGQEDDGRDDENEKKDADEDGDDEADAESKKSPRCSRVYNERNCCDQEEFCRNTAQKLREATIRDVTVSITPPLVPLAEDDTEIEEQRERLLKAPIRSWTNRQGGLVATGRLADFQDEAIIVETPEGGRISIPYFDIGYDDLCFLTAWWRLPGECLLAGDDRAMRNFEASTFTWKASAVCHKPLFFEEVQLERYGHSAGPILQPLLSGAHFISNIQLLPYNMGVYPPTECRYVLGHYRPGSCAPWLIPAFPLSHRGVAWELGAAFGLWGLF